MVRAETEDELEMLALAYVEINLFQSAQVVGRNSERKVERNLHKDELVISGQVATLDAVSH